MSWIQTYTGKKVSPATLQVEGIDIKDIAHSLALQCRFAGHCEVFYSVAILPKFQKIENKFNVVASDIVGKMNWSIDEITNRFNNFSNKLTDSFQFPSGLAPTVLDTRAISRDSFQVLNSTSELIEIHYLCVG